MKFVLTKTFFFIALNVFGYNINQRENVVKTLDSIFDMDQTYRLKLKQDNMSPELKIKMLNTIKHNDCINLIKVKAILKRHGWLGPEQVGKKGSDTLFLVIQHADLKTQEKLLPMIQSEVKIGRISMSKLALLEDRISVMHGKKQQYGTQIGSTPDGKYFIYPIKNPKGLALEREKAGLQPMDEYVKNWNLSWNL